MKMTDRQLHALGSPEAMVEILVIKDADQAQGRDGTSGLTKEGLGLVYQMVCCTNPSAADRCTAVAKGKNFI